VALAAAAVALPLTVGIATTAGANSPAARFPGQNSGLLPAEKLTVKSALQVDLTRETVRLPLFKAHVHGQDAWYVITEASDPGIAADLNVNHAAKLNNLSIGCDTCVQTAGVEAPSPEQNRFGTAVIDRPGAPDFSPTRVLEPGPQGFPPAKAQPGGVADDSYSPFIRLAGSPVVYNAPIVATGDGPFDVVHHTNTEDRVLGIHIAPPAAPGKFNQSWVDLLLVKGFDAGQPILYLSTESDDPGTATLERSTYVPSLSQIAYNGGDDALGSARERIFPFLNGQTGANNRQAQGIAHLILDGHAAEDASAGNTALINALRNGGDALNVQGDFPTLTDPRHAEAYSPIWEAQFGQWTDKAIKLGLNTRQIDENQIFNLAASRPDLITGPGGAPYGAQGVIINCPVIGFTADPPTDNLATPLPDSQH
jgi:hypothetical protein